MIESYTEMKNRLMQLFGIDSYQDRDLYEQHHEVDRAGDSRIWICYPGRKRRGWDYRVDIALRGEAYDPNNPITPTHLDVAFDLYRRVQCCQELSAPLRTMLSDLAKDERIDPQQYECLYRCQPHPSQAEGIEYTMLELTYIIRWITLQEEFNYPIPLYEGRKMPFKRYLEAIEAGSSDCHSIDEVIRRAQVRGGRVPINWNDLDYMGIDDLEGILLETDSVHSWNP
mgnify:CR=1 FL=1